MVCGTVNANSIEGFYDPKSIVYGERSEVAYIRFHTTEYNLLVCEQQEDPENRVGFHVAQLEGTETLIFYCGTKYKTGDIIIITFDDGI